MAREDRAVDDPTPEDCERGLAEARELAGKILRGEGDALRLADSIYWAGYLNGGFAGTADKPPCPELNDVAATFVQFTAYIHVAQNKAEATREAIAEIREAAQAFLEGRPLHS